MIPRTALYALLLLLGSALWSLVPPLLFLTTGWKARTGSLDISSAWVQAVLVVFLAGFGALLFTGRKPGKPTEVEPLLAAGFSILFLYLGYTLLNFQAYLLMTGSHAVSFDGAVWIFLGTGVLFLALLLLVPKKGEWALAATLIFLSALVCFSIKTFPLFGGYSDMLLNMEAGGRALLHGVSPYALQTFQGEPIQCCYPPGLWLAFLPAVALNFDPRFLEFFYTLIFALLVWLSLGPKERPLGSWFLVLFLLNPWTLLRQEGYLYAYLVSWGAFFLALNRNHRVGAVVCFGWGLSAHPFSWALLPVWAVWNARRRGWRDAGRDTMGAVGVAALIVLPFLFWSPENFFHGALLHWVGTGAVTVSHVGLVVWLSRWPDLLIILAVAFLSMGVWAVGRGTGSTDSLYRWLAFSLTLALFASYHIEHYYYFVPLAFLLFHETVLLRKEDGGEPGS